MVKWACGCMESQPLDTAEMIREESTGMHAWIMLGEAVLRVEKAGIT